MNSILQCLPLSKPHQRKMKDRHNDWLRFKQKNQKIINAILMFVVVVVVVAVVSNFYGLPSTDFPPQHEAGSVTSGKRFKMKKKNSFNDGQTVDVPVSWQLKNDDERCRSMSKFIVFTTINPSDDEKWPAIRDFNALPGWCTVVVGDKASESKTDFMHQLDANKVIYLDEDAQNEFFGDSPIFQRRLVPWRSFARKNVGYLYAALRGAEVIYDTDDDNVLIDKKKIPFWTASGDHWDPTISVKKVADSRLDTLTTFDIFSVFAHRDSAEHTARVWPRGYDLSVLAESLRTHSTFTLEDAGDGGDSVRYPIQQWLANVEPDFDAIGRLIGNNNAHRPQTKYQFDPERRFAVSIPNHLFVPFNAQMTVWLSSSFPLLYLPTTVAGRVSDIWRSYIAQTVLRVLAAEGIKQRLLYCPVLVDQLRNAHDNLADFNAELPLYEQTPALLEHLAEFAKSYTLHEGEERGGGDETQVMGKVLIDLYVDLYEHDIIGLNDVKGIRAWLSMMSGPRTHSQKTITVPSNDEVSPTDCLVIIMGQLRAKELTWPSFKEYVLEPTGCDLALAISAKPGESVENNEYYAAAKYRWLFNEEALDGESDRQRWTRLLKETYRSVYDRFGGQFNGKPFQELDAFIERMSNNKGNVAAPVGRKGGSGVIQLVLRQFVHENLQKLNRQYSYKLYVRGDYKYLCPFPLDKLTKDRTAKGIWISSGQDWGGYSDRNTLASSNLFADTMPVLLSILTETEATCFNGNLESAVKCHFELQSLPTPHRYDGPMFTVKANDTETRWSGGAWNDEYGLFVKYGGELKLAKRACSATQRV